MGMTENTEAFSFVPIGRVECSRKYRFEAPRQAVFADNDGLIRLEPHRNLETAVRDLTGFERIWVIYCFHLNHDWKPAVQPPVGSDGRRIGVLATRSPHRPNPVGLSCVELERVDGLLLHIRNFDMLDGTPVLDVKPYIPAADAFPQARTGWLQPVRTYTLEYTPEFIERADWIRQLSELDLISFCRTQLVLEPLDAGRKRLWQEGKTNWLIGCRTWRIRFRMDEAAGRVTVLDVFSAYEPEELEPDAEDRYGDKTVHRTFRQRFPAAATSISGEKPRKI